MIIATFNRDALLPTLISHLATIPPPSLRHIVLVWQNVERPLPDFLSPSSLIQDYPAIPITVRISSQNSMNERFRPMLDWGEEIKTEAVMIMDDDVVLRLASIEWGYHVFRYHNRIDELGGGIVGFTGRDYAEASPMNQLYKWDYVFQPTNSYSMVLSNAAWFRRSWLHLYWSQTREIEELRTFVDDGEFFFRFILLRTNVILFLF
jgi:hypothetical protein